MCVIKVKDASYDRYEELIMRREELKKECLFWSNEYTRVFGELVVAIFKEKLLCAKKKKAIEFSQASLKKIQQVELATVRDYVNSETYNLQENLKRLKSEYEMVQNQRAIPDEDFAELKELFRQIVKLIHPDINPLLKRSSKLRRLWNLAVFHYQRGELRELQEIKLIAGEVLDKLCGKKYEIDIPDIDGKIVALELEIKKIMRTNAFQYRALLIDADLVAKKKEYMRQELKSYKGYGIQLNRILMDYLPGGKPTRWARGGALRAEGSPTRQESNLVSIINTAKFDDFVKPTICEIRLFDSFIAGTTHLVDKSPLETVAVGDELTMQREDNPHDRHAIMILNSEKKKLGYVPKKDNLVFARLMDAGKILKAKITKIEERRKFKFIRLEIFLVDL